MEVLFTIILAIAACCFIAFIWDAFLCDLVMLLIDLLETAFIYVTGAAIGVGLLVLLWRLLSPLLATIWSYMQRPLLLICAAIVAAAFLAGVVTGLVMYVRALLEYANPYQPTRFQWSRGSDDVYRDRSSRREPNARRSYFSGPGWYSLGMTLRSAWSYSFGCIGDAFERFSEAQEAITDFLSFDIWFLRLLIGVPVHLLFIAYALSAIAASSLMTLVFATLHAALLTLVAIPAVAIRTILGLLDFLCIRLLKIRTLCPACKQQAQVPAFACSCGRKHTHLTPSPYGVFTHRCLCGKRLPTTIFGGRSRLAAHCPRCTAPLAASDARQLSLTLIGGAGSGKTTFLAAFFHQFLEDIRRRRHLRAEIPTLCQENLRRMEAAFQGRDTIRTTCPGTTSVTHSLLLSGRGLSVRRQFSLFDMSGDRLSSPKLCGMLHTDEMAGSNGLIIVVDPFASPLLAQEARDTGEQPNASPADPSVIVNNFVTHLHTLAHGPKPGEKITRPTAVIITRTSSPCIARQLSHAHIANAMQRHPGIPAHRVQDRICRAFLERNGFGSLLTALDAQFSNFRFFPVDSCGSIRPDGTFRPDKLHSQPIHWLLRETDPALADALGCPKADRLYPRASRRRIAKECPT